MPGDPEREQGVRKAMKGEFVKAIAGTGRPYPDAFSRSEQQLIEDLYERAVAVCMRQKVEGA